MLCVVAREEGGIYVSCLLLYEQLLQPEILASSSFAHHKLCTVSQAVADNVSRSTELIYRHQGLDAQKHMHKACRSCFDQQDSDRELMFRTRLLRQTLLRLCSCIITIQQKLHLEPVK